LGINSYWWKLTFKDYMIIRNIFLDYFVCQHEKIFSQFQSKNQIISNMCWTKSPTFGNMDSCFLHHSKGHVMSFLFTTLLFFSFLFGK
jgi:hypothetical protein